jgi:hypothetical protein
MKQPVISSSVRNVKAQQVQCDEIWSFVYAKDKNVAEAKAARTIQKEKPPCLVRGLGAARLRTDLTTWHKHRA